MKNQRILIIIVSLILIAGLLNCGKDNPADGGDPPTPPPQEDPMKVGSDGGSVSNADNTVTLNVPSGSLSSEVTFTIGETTSHPGDAVGTVYDIGPDGTGFDPPATLTLKYEEADLPAGAQESELVLATVENNTWLHLTTTVDEQNNRVSAEIEHLSVYGIRWDNSNIVAEEGGTVASADSTVVLEIPEGALFKETTFTFEELTSYPEGAIGKVYDIGPDGTQFELPVTLTFSYDESDIPAGLSEEDFVMGILENGEWVTLKSTRDTVSNYISTEIWHLSVYSIVQSPKPFIQDVYTKSGFQTVSWASAYDEKEDSLIAQVDNYDPDENLGELLEEWMLPCNDPGILGARAGTKLYPPVHGETFSTSAAAASVSSSSYLSARGSSSAFDLDVNASVDLRKGSLDDMIDARARGDVEAIDYFMTIINPTGEPFDIHVSWSAIGNSNIDHGKLRVENGGYGYIAYPSECESLAMQGYFNFDYVNPSYGTSKGSSVYTLPEGTYRAWVVIQYFNVGVSAASGPGDPKTMVGSVSTEIKIWID